MKKKVVNLFIILGIIIVLVVISLIIFWNMNRMKGNVFVTIHGEECPLTGLECNYIGKDTEEKISYEINSSGMTFQNRGMLHGMYEYSFEISNGEINITPKIQVFKTNWWEIYNIRININVYEENETWNADVSVDVKERHYQETFYDIENNTIEFRVE